MKELQVRKQFLNRSSDPVFLGKVYSVQEALDKVNNYKKNWDYRTLLTIEEKKTVIFVTIKIPVMEEHFNVK